MDRSRILPRRGKSVRKNERSVRQSAAGVVALEIFNKKRWSREEALNLDRVSRKVQSGAEHLCRRPL